MDVAGRKIETAHVGSKDDQIFCELCENVKTSADGACPDCDEYMCDTCFKHHLKAKACRNHVLVNLDELSLMTLKNREEDVETCKKHDHETIKFYCRVHDVTGCGDCMIFEHAACKPEYIKDLLATFKTEEKFKQLFAKVDSMQMESEERLKKNKNEIDLLKEKTLMEIRQFRSEINDFFDKAEAKITSEVEKITSENTEKHKKLEQDVMSLIREIEEVKLKLSSNKKSNQENAYFIQTISCKPQIVEIEKRYECILIETFFEKYEFVRSDILLTRGQFGKLKTGTYIYYTLYSKYITNCIIFHDFRCIIFNCLTTRKKVKYKRSHVHSAIPCRMNLLFRKSFT